MLSWIRWSPVHGSLRKFQDETVEDYRENGLDTFCASGLGFGENVLFQVVADLLSCYVSCSLKRTFRTTASRFEGHDALCSIAWLSKD
jgi:hypothetical protein